MKLEKIIRSLALAATLIIGKASAEDYSAKHNLTKHVYAQGSTRFNLGLGQVNTNLSEEKRTIPIHPQDGGPSRGQVTTDVNKGNTISQLKLGVEGSLGTDYLRFKVGVDGRLRGYTFGPYDSADTGNYEKYTDQKLQPLPREEGYRSYGYSFFRMKPFSLNPFIGIEAILFKRLGLGAEVGLIHSDFKWEKGHYRWNKYSKIESDTCTSDGNSLNITLLYKFDEDFDEIPGFIGLSYSREDYDINLAGEDSDVEVESIFLIGGVSF